ncbi:hypothetical protein [Mycolicibacterium komossense]|uniref:Lipoprotein LppI n=1 Tax=Mycolicibacterium komossense TaxID=1779 RepID=A0ABT3C869_9MYCO|nr:hypothetical protein [Mycolicibacterium komossense]MCV7225611.1 hypothetical protein [Mycolicibacterium komossense]
MRIVLPITALLLVAGCSGADGGQADRSATPSQSSSSSSSAPPKTSTTSPVAVSAPPQGTPIGAVIGWVEAGKPADLAGFHTANRDGATTQLNHGVAFTTPSGRTTCMSGMTAFDDGELACLTQMSEGPAKPAAVGPDGQWIPGWIDYPGDTLTVGGLHGDPGQFGYGTGAELSYGQRLRFGDYQCRTDQIGLFCVNYAHQSGVRISDAGVQPFGCLRAVDPGADELVGLKFGC